MAQTPVTRCPRCTGPLPAQPDQPAQCQACGLVLGPDLLGELTQLDRLEQWAGQRRDWVRAMGEYRAAAPTTAPAAGPVAAAPVAPPATHRTATAQSCLLTAGAFALVAAGITFVAVTWGTLSDAGRFVALFTAGALALLIAWVSASRIKATASTLAIAGSLLIVVDVVFLLANTEAQRAPAVAALASGIGVAGIAYARRARSRLPGAAAAVALISAALAILAVVTAPLIGETNREWFLGWAAAVFVASGLALLVWGALDRTVAWSWPATLSLVLATGPAADQAARLVDDSLGDVPGWLVPAAVLLLGAAALLVVDRLTGSRWPALLVGSVVLHAIVVLVLVASLESPAQRGWTALGLLVWAISWVGLVAHTRAHHQGVAGSLSLLNPWLAGLASALSVAALAAYVPTLVEFDDFGRTAVADAYPWWRGALLGAISTFLAAGALLAVERSAVAGRVAAFAWPVAVLLVWIGLVAGDADRAGLADLGFTDRAETVGTAVAAATLATGVGTILLSSLWRQVWSLWLGATTTVVGVLAAWSVWDTSDWSTPELLAVALATPLAAAGAMHAQITRPRPVPTLISVAPALVALLLPPTVSVLSDTGERWFAALFTGDAPVSTSALVRSVTLTLVAAVLAVVGVRQRWAGVFWPGLLCLVVVVGAQLVDLADRLPPWLVLSLVGVALVGAGARWESVRAGGRRGRAWAGDLR